MAHEIYYTSAPEGLRPGDRGFCTVAATKDIPRLLWDRLEALSGYRHNPDGANPVALAHWVLNLSGQNYHVLSRVCDAGLDYTQRTNSFAHHIVLEPHELAAGGPASMIASGALQERWDGQVGPIVRYSPLPRGDVSPRVCSSWQSATGDAGWAGVVAQAIATSAWKPIGLVFAPGQDVLPLIAEVTALLPAHQRWQVTFNTYFTNLPGAMTCQWRCCIAGSPAAVNAIRSSAGGVAIDLSRPDSIGTPPESAWVEAARTGRPVSTASKAPMPTPKAAAAPVAKAPAPLPQPIAQAPVAPEPFVARTEKPVTITRGGLVRTEQATHDTPSVPVPEFSWMAQRRAARQRQLMILYAVACIVLALGLWMAIWAYHSSADRPLPPAVPVVVVPAPIPTTEPVVVPAPAIVHTPTTQIVHTPTTLPTVVVPKPTIDVPKPPPPPANFAIDPLPPIDAGNGMRSPVSTLIIAPGKLDHLDGITTMTITFPDGAQQWQFKSGELDGVFKQTPGKTPHPHVQIKWNDTAGLAPPTLIATVRLAKPKSVLDVTWNNTALLNTPDIVKLCYWMLQNSTLTVSDDNGIRVQHITFASVPIKPMRLTDPDFAGSFPTNLPVAPEMHLGKSTPEGWLPGTSPMSKPEPGTVVLRVEKPPGSAGIVPGFDLRYSPSHRTLSSDLAKVVETAKADLESAKEDSDKVKVEIQGYKDNFQPGTTTIEQSIKDWSARKEKATAASQPGDLTPEQIQSQIEKLQQDLATRQTNLTTAIAPLLAKQKEADDRAAAINEALSSYAELNELDIELNLPQGLHVGTVRLTKEGN